MSMCNEWIVDRALKRCRPYGHVQVVITKLSYAFFQVRVKFPVHFRKPIVYTVPRLI